MELGLRVEGVRRKRHFDFPSLDKGPDGPSRAPRKRHSGFPSFSQGPAESSGPWG